MLFAKKKRTINKELTMASADLRCTACYRRGAEKHHIKTKKSGGGDEESNLMPLDRIHHTEVHAIGLNAFAEKYPMVSNWLLAHGWKFSDYKNKWIKPD